MYRFIAFLSVSPFFLSISAQSNGDFVTNATQLKDTAKIYAESLVNEFYKTNPLGSATGLFYSKPAELGGDVLPWSQSAVLWDSLIAYANLTGDTQFNNVVVDALNAQLGENDLFMPANQTRSLGNSNQTQWALAALSAAEMGLTREKNGDKTFAQIAQDVFDVQTIRWDNNCTGGLRDAIFTFNDGFTQKSSFAASGFFLLASRLHVRTGNTTFGEWAEKQFKWAQDVGLIGKEGEILDILEINDDDCSLDKDEGATSSNLGNWIEGVALMANASNATPWTDRLDLLAKSIPTFTSLNGTNLDVDCSASSNESSECGLSRTSQYVRSLSRAVAYAPRLSSNLLPLLQNTARKAKSTCGEAISQGSNSDKTFKFTAYCASTWATLDSSPASSGGNFGDSVNVGAALEAVQGLLWTMKREEGNTGTGSPTSSPSPSAKPTGDGNVRRVEWTLVVGSVAVVMAFLMG